MDFMDFGCAQPFLIILIIRVRIFIPCLPWQYNRGNPAGLPLSVCRHLDSDQGPPPCQGDTLTS